MVHRLDRAISWLTSGVVAGIALSADSVLDWLRHQHSLNALSTLVILVAAALVFRLSEVGAEWVVSHSATLRKIILQSHFIEGYWINSVQFVDSDTELDSIGLIRIAYVGRRYEISGDNLDKHAKPLGNFRYYISEYDNYKLRYAYDGNNKRQIGGHVEGYGEFSFTPADGGPLSFDGFIRDNYHGEPVILHGERIINPQTVATLNDVTTRVRLIEMFLAGNLHSADAQHTSVGV